MARRKLCLIFTGPEPCGEQNLWCDPWFGFTGKICTPSIAEKTVALRGKVDFITRRQASVAASGQRETAPQLVVNASSSPFPPGAQKATAADEHPLCLSPVSWDP
jgi:hypothetical protein